MSILSVLLNDELTSSKFNTLLPIEEVKSLILLDSKITWSEITLLSILNVFSLVRSKSNTVFISITDIKSVTISKLLSVCTVLTPTLISSLITKSLNCLNPAVWFKDDTAFCHFSNGTSDLIAYEKYW